MHPEAREPDRARSMARTSSHESSTQGGERFEDVREVRLMKVSAGDAVHRYTRWPDRT